MSGTDPSGGGPAPRVPLAPVLLVNFIGTMGFSIVLPFLVFLVTRWGGDALVYGLIGATYPVFQFLGAPLLGRWSDGLGRRRVLLISQGGTFVSWLVFCGALLLPVTDLAAWHLPGIGAVRVTLPLLVLFAARAVDGLTGGNIAVANAYVADISTDADRSRNFGRMGVASNLGLIAGPGLAAVLGATPWGDALPVLAAAAVSGIALGVIAVWLPESHPAPRAPAHPERAGSTFGQEPLDCHVAAAAQGAGMRAALAQPGVWFLLALNFVVLLAFNFYYTAFPAHAAADLHWTVVQNGVFFGVLSLALVVVEGPVLSRLARRLPEAWLVIGGCAVLALNFALMRSARVDLIYLGVALFALGNGVMWPSLVSIVAATGDAAQQGAIQGLVGGAGSLAAIVGLVAGGVGFGLIGADTMWASAALALLAAVLALGLLRRQPRAAA